MSTSELSGADYAAMMAFLGQAHQVTGTAQLAELLMHGLSGLVPCDLISYNEIDLVGGATETYFEPALIPRPELEEAFSHLIHEHPLVVEYARTRDPRALRMSDFISLPELKSRDIYREVFLPLETNHQLAFSVAINNDLVVGIGLNRRRIDFNDRDVAMMHVLQPHLAAAFDHAVLKQRHAQQLSADAALAERLSHLTPREGEVAQLVATGYTNRRIARTLLISERTVEKHVANVLIKLSLPSRVALAVALRP